MWLLALLNTFPPLGKRQQHKYAARPNPAMHVFQITDHGRRANSRCIPMQADAFSVHNYMYMQEILLL